MTRAWKGVQYMQRRVRDAPGIRRVPPRRTFPGVNLESPNPFKRIRSNFLKTKIWHVPRAQNIAPPAFSPGD
jgi:hypothetical protein